MKRRWHVYLLRCRDGSLYCGITVDLKTRLAKHNAGAASKYTRARLPVVLAWSKAMKDATAARKREAKIKGLPRREKVRIISGL